MRADRLSVQLLRGGFGSLVVRVVGLLVEFALSVVLARALAAEGYGVYAYAIAMMRILAVPAQAGLPTLAVREVAAYQAVNDWSHLRGFLSRVNQIALAFSALIVIGVLLAVGAGLRVSQASQETFLWSLLLIPLIALGNIRGAILRGFRKVVEGQLPESVIRPGVFLLLVVTSVAVVDSRLSPQAAMALHALSATVAFGIGIWLLLRHVPREVGLAQPAYETRRWVLAAVPLSMIMAMMVINNQAAILVLGLFEPHETVGVFGVVAQLALVITVPVTVANTVLAPHLSRLYVQKDFAKLQVVSTWSSRTVLAACLLVGMVLAGFAEPLLSIAFGAEFKGGAKALIVLCLGQVGSAAMGVSMIILNMTRNEAAVAKSFIVAVVINIGLSFALVPSFGLTGAATAVAVSLLVLNLMMAIGVYRLIGLNPFAISFARAVKRGSP